MGRVVKVTPNEGLTISFPFGRMGSVGLFHLSDAYSEAPLEDFAPQKIVRSAVFFLVPARCGVVGFRVLF